MEGDERASSAFRRSVVEGEHRLSRSTTARLAAGGAGALVHAIVVSVVMFAALPAGAPFGYLDWLGMLVRAYLGNIVGGVGLVTMLRLVQVGRGTVGEERDVRGVDGAPSEERPALRRTG